MSDFYAVFVQESYHVPGDERSRKCPGHGYPAHTEHYTSVIKFSNKADLEKWVKHNESLAFAKKTYEVVKCTPLKVKTQLEIVVDVEDGTETPTDRD